MMVILILRPLYFRMSYFASEGMVYFKVPWDFGSNIMRISTRDAKARHDSYKLTRLEDRPGTQAYASLMSLAPTISIL